MEFTGWMRGVLLLVVGGWLGGCVSGPAERTAAVPVLPETYDGPAETPSSFVAKPIMLRSAVPSPGRSRVVKETMLAEVVFEYVVDEYGEVIAYRTIETNHPGLAESVRAWISSAHFVPGVKAGKNVTVRVRDRHFVDVSRTRVIHR